MLRQESYHLYETRCQRSFVPIKLVETEKLEILRLWTQAIPDAPGRVGRSLSQWATRKVTVSIPSSPSEGVSPGDPISLIVAKVHSYFWLRRGLRQRSGLDGRCGRGR